MKGLSPRYFHAKSWVSLVKPGTASRKQAHKVLFPLVKILFPISFRFVVCECLVECPAHAVAHELVHWSALFSTVLGAVGYRFAAATVSMLASGGGGGLTRSANPVSSRGLLLLGGSGSCGMDSVGLYLVEHVAEIVAHGVHSRFSLCCVTLCRYACCLALPLSPCAFPCCGNVI